MKATRASALLAFVLLAVPAGRAPAMEVQGSAQTLLLARQQPRWDESQSVVPLYELVSLNMRELPVPLLDDAQLVMQGFGRLQLANQDLEPHDADVGLLYFDGTAGPVRLRLGRQHALGGLGRMRLFDGVDARVALPLGISLGAYFGASVHPRFRYDRGSWQTGARAAVQLPGPGQLALSYVHERRKGSIAFEEVGFDGFYVVGPVRLVALASVNPREQALSEARLAASWRIFEGLDVSLDGEHVSPDLFVPATSIFSVFSSTPHDALGTDVQWSPDPFWEVVVAGQFMLNDWDWLGMEAHARVTTYREPSHRSLMGAEIQRQQDDLNGWVRGRLFAAIEPFESLRTTGELNVYGFDHPRNGVSYSIIGRLGLLYDVIPSIRLAGSVSAGSTPHAQGFVEGTLRFVYGLDTEVFAPNTEVAP